MIAMYYPLIALVVSFSLMPVIIVSFVDLWKYKSFKNTLTDRFFAVTAIICLVLLALDIYFVYASVKWADSLEHKPGIEGLLIAVAILSVMFTPVCIVDAKVKKSMKQEQEKCMTLSHSPTLRFI